MKTLFKNGYKAIVSLLLIFITLSKTSAQTGINTITPDASSALEIKSTNKGLLIPRLTQAQKNAILSPATGLMVYDITTNCISVNIGTPSVPEWNCTTLLNRKIFYMPSINISTKIGLIGIPQTKDLYREYADEFTAPKMVSAGAPSIIPVIANAQELNYYVTYYDPSLIEISGIDANGVMSYKILKPANFDSYINIVFAPK